MSQSTANPITIPASLTGTTSALPNSTQRALINHLRDTHSIPELSQILSDSLARSGWTDRVRALSLELLRNGSCDTFPQLMEEVMRRAKLPRDSNSTASQTSGASAAKDGANGVQTNGTSTPTAGPLAGQGAIVVSKEWSGGPDGLPDVRVPLATVEFAGEYLRERVKDAIKVEGE